MNIYYHSLYTEGIDPESSFPRERYRLIKKKLEGRDSFRILEPQKADISHIYKAHSKEYVDRFLSYNLTEKEIREIGLKPWTENIIDRTLLITGGSLSALNDLLKGDPVSGNMAGGTHHAQQSKGSGFCIFNDLAICAMKAIESTEFKRVLILDLDVHQGDGTAQITRDISSIFTFSMHCKQNYPFKKQVSDLDIEVESGTKDHEYIATLSMGLDKLKDVDCDIIFYQAGVDTLAADRYGKLNLSISGIKSRDELVFTFAKERKCPVLVLMGGGYSEPIDETVEAFESLFLTAKAYNYKL